MLAPIVDLRRRAEMTAVDGDEQRHKRRAKEIDQQAKDLVLEACHRLDRAMKSRRMTQSDVAEILDINQGNISNIFRGKTPGVSLHMIAKIAAAMNVSLAWVLEPPPPYAHPPEPDDNVPTPPFAPVIPLTPSKAPRRSKKQQEK